MLSGFVLTVAYGSKLGDGRMSARDFLVAARGAPLPVLPGSRSSCSLPFALVHRSGWVTAAFGDASCPRKAVTGLGHATMTHVLVPRLVTSWNLPDWCVSVEMWFYVAYPASSPGCWRWPRDAHRSSPSLPPRGSSRWPRDRLHHRAARRLHGRVESTAFWLTLSSSTPYARWPEFLVGVVLGVLWLPHAGRVAAGRASPRRSSPAARSPASPSSSTAIACPTPCCTTAPAPAVRHADVGRSCSATVRCTARCRCGR